MEDESCIKLCGEHQRTTASLKKITLILVWINLVSLPLLIYSVVSVFWLQIRVDILQQEVKIILLNDIQKNEAMLESLKQFQDEYIRLLGKFDQFKIPTFNGEEENYGENDYYTTTEYNETDEEKDDDDDNDDGDDGVGDADYNIFESDGLKSKTKREIRDYDLSSEKEHKSASKNKTEKSVKASKSSAEREKSSTEVSSEITSKEKFLPSSYKFTYGSTRKPHFHKKHRKSRIGSAEKYYIEYQSTTTAPIQVRRSRTKSTESQDVEKTVSLSNEKFQLHTSPHRDTITKEEAYFRGYGRRNSGETAHYVESSRESSRERSFDLPTYNMITIHFSADTSHYSRERDPHYFGNGRMQIKSEVYKDWKPAHWTQGVKMSKYFHLHQGRVTVSTTGIYLIYAQIQYSNVQEVNGFSVFRNKEVVVQCITTSTHPDKQEIKSNTCGISTTILLQSNDSVCIKDLHHGRYVVLTPEKSYFGLVLLSPFKN